MANIKICLIVDTKKISKGRTDKSCYFIDNTTKLISYDPRDYITYVDRGQMIEWSGKAESPLTMDCVSIDSISKTSKKGGNDMFGVPIVIGSNGKITATVIAAEKKGDDEEYRIRFTVIRNKNGKSKSYAIDPKLRVKT
jgi:hypothetical protein